MKSRTQLKITPSDLRRQAEKMIASGTMLNLETVLQTVSEIRAKYVPLILKARKENS